MANEINPKGALMVCTLLSIVAGLVPSLIYWVLAKNKLEGDLKTYLVNLLNFELTVFILLIVCGVVFAPLTGLISLINLICLIIATLKLSKEQIYKFPMTIQLIK